MSIDSQMFKAGMRRVAGSVCVITTAAADGARFGLTATAMSSVSADPPTLLVCLNTATGTCAQIRAAGRFAVNVLSADQSDVSQRFASPIPPEERFVDEPWAQLVTGAPTLMSACAVFDCQVQQATEVATHTLLIGSIAAVHLGRENDDPLLYLQGAYGNFAPHRSLRPAHGAMTYKSPADLQFLEDGLHWGLL
jgi:flavin reductase (DIM6/NTAB) family NADH-FMN oxidoreductase RutF